jgi:hypothetical protein
MVLHIIISTQGMVLLEIQGDQSIYITSNVVVGHWCVKHSPELYLLARLTYIIRPLYVSFKSTA